MIVTAAQTEAAPWWGIPLIAGMFAILGVVATQWVTWTLDRGRSQREDARRWHADRRAAYAAYLAQVDELLRAAWEYLRGVARDDAQMDREWSAAVDVFRVANIRRQDVRLLASDEVGEAADQLYELFRPALRAAPLRRGDEPTADLLVSRCRTQIDGLLSAMRQELGTGR